MSEIQVALKSAAYMYVTTNKKSLSFEFILFAKMLTISKNAESS